MIEYEGKCYYSISEITKYFNFNDKKTELLKKKFCEVYKKSIDIYFTEQYLQSKIYKAAKVKKVRYLKYKKESGDREYYVFYIGDIMEFLNSPAAQNIQQKQYKVIEVSDVE